MKKMMKIVILILFIGFVSCSYNSNNINNQKHNDIIIIKNMSNIFLFIPGIDVNSEFIQSVLKNYSYIINNFIHINEFSEKKIEEQNIVFVIVNNSFDELSMINDEIIEKLNKLNPDKNYKYIKYSHYIIDKKTENADAFYDYNSDVIAINYKNIETKLDFILTILAEYNHYLLYNNIKNNFGTDFLKKIYIFPIFHIDESITYFFSSSLQFQIIDKNITNLDKYDMFLTIPDLDNYIKEIDIFLISYVRTIGKSLKFIPYKDICLGYATSDFSILILYYGSLIPVIVNCYGYEYVNYLIRYLYSNRYCSIEQIIYEVFSDSFDNFIRYWENRVKLILNE